MDNTGEVLVELLKSYEPAEWDRFPQMQLYMDQMLGCLGDFRGPVDNEENKNTSLLTANMVNNYVKDGLVPHPEGRRYDRSRVSLLYMLMMLKPVLPLSKAAEGLKSMTANMTVCNVSRLFAGEERISCVRAAELIAELLEVYGNDSDGKKRVALRLAIEANVLRLCAEKIFDELISSSPESDV